MTTLQEMIKLAQSFPIHIKKTKTSKSVADQLLGSCKGILPKGKTSTSLIRKLRDTVYGKCE